MDELIQLTGLWENTTSTGDQYFSGSLGGARVLIFKNKKKTNEKSPDWTLFVTKRAEKPQGEVDVPF